MYAFMSGAKSLDVQSLFRCASHRMAQLQVLLQGFRGLDDTAQALGIADMMQNC